MESKTITAPWTPEQVAGLNRWQQANDVHPFTCGTDSRHGALVATPDGWYCPACDYRQDWAHDFMVRPAPEAGAAGDGWPEGYDPNALYEGWDDAPARPAPASETVAAGDKAPWWAIVSPQGRIVSLHESERTARRFADRHHGREAQGWLVQPATLVTDTPAHPAPAPDDAAALWAAFSEGLTPDEAEALRQANEALTAREATMPDDVRRIRKTIAHLLGALAAARAREGALLERADSAERDNAMLLKFAESGQPLVRINTPDGTHYTFQGSVERYPSKMAAVRAWYKYWGFP